MNGVFRWRSRIIRPSSQCQEDAGVGTILLRISFETCRKLRIGVILLGECRHG